MPKPIKETQVLGEVGVLINDGTEISLTWDFSKQEDLDKWVGIAEQAYEKVATVNEIHEKTKSWMLVSVLDRNLHDFKQFVLRKFY